jgi:hypothetical protein
VIFVALPASAQEGDRRINLIHGHPVYDASNNEAGVTMGLSISHDQTQAGPLVTLCTGLRDAAGLGDEHGDGLRLQALFVVPHKGMAIEGYYLPIDGASQVGVLVAGKSITRTTLDRIVAQAGIPPSVLDETSVEHEISCQPGEPLWTIAWHDVRPIGGEEPEAVIERARNRFLAIHKSVVKRVMGAQWSHTDTSATLSPGKVANSSTTWR